MLLEFFNLAHERLWHVDSNDLPEHEADDVIEEGIIALFGDFPSPPCKRNMSLVGVDRDGFQHWSVGPFALLVKTGEE